MLINARGKKIMRHLAVAFLVAAAFAAPAGSQVKGVCVSGCTIPTQPQQPQQPADPDVSPQYLIGFVGTVTGDVTFTYPSGRQAKADTANRTPITFGTRVTTGPDGKVQVLLLDETSFTVGPNSEMVMDEFVYDPAGGFKKVSGTVIKGVFRFITGKISRKDPDALKVKIAVGAIGIRGTDFELEAYPDGSGFILLHEGELVLDEYDSNQSFAVHPGQTLRWENFKIVGVE